MWKTRQLTHKPEILTFLETDRLYNSYAIGDMEPELYIQSTWAGAETAGELGALVLYFRGLVVPALFLTGNSQGLQAILHEVLCPERVYLTCLMNHLPVAGNFYTWHSRIAMWRMVLERGSFQPVKSNCGRLTLDHSDQLEKLYAHGEGVEYNTTQLERGVFYGLFVDDQLVAAAGTHLVSQSYSVAALGNVLTHPDYRGAGFGTQTTSAVVRELVELRIRDIVLNVSQDNQPAVRIYEMLGFKRYCAFIEGLATTRGADIR